MDSGSYGRHYDFEMEEGFMRDYFFHKEHDKEEKRTIGPASFHR